MKLSRTIAAIDVGTNSFHMIIARISDSGKKVQIIGREKEVVRLGSGGSDMKHLSEGAMNHACQTLERFRGVAQFSGASIRAIATSAVREALNRRDLIDRVRKETGIRLEVASGFEEGRLIYLGVLQGLPIYQIPALVIAIGGGSAEFTLGKQRTMLYNNSIKLGAVRLSDRFFPKKKTSSRAVKECREYVEGMLAPVARSLKEKPREIAVGCSGTIMAFASMIRAEEFPFAAGSLNGFVIKRSQVSDTLERVIEAETPGERAKIRGLDPQRADIILAGGIILDQILKTLKIDELCVSEYGMREGILLDTMEKEMRVRLPHLNDIRSASVQQLSEQFHSEERHARHVANLALDIFKRTKQIHKLGETERELLEAAAMLHEIGLYISHAQHHRHAYYLIRNAELPGYTEDEKAIIANVARYHRKSEPKPKHEGYAELDAHDRTVVRKLAAILRIADGLDRGHAAVVKGVSMRRSGKRIVFRLQHKKRAPASLEVWGAERKKQMFEHVFGSRLEFRENGKIKS
jgi:exopolyphosphatase/guanosine-5'-triphosphate,3'-diphosphate pyrophosphatase